MAFVAPFIVGALGLTGAAASLATAGIGLGVAFAATKLKPKQKSQTGWTGAQVGLKIETNPSRSFVAGERLVGGSLAFWHLSGANNEKLWMVIALADHRCASLEGVVVSKQMRAWNSGTGEVATYGANLKVRFYRGLATQVADAALVAASGGRWLSTARGDNVCYVVVEATYDEKLFPEGIPELGFKIRGADFLIDPRTGAQGYSDNVAVVIYNLLRGIYVGGQKLIGMTVPVSAIRLSEAQAAANACDELMALAGGGTEKRYRCGVELECSMDNQDILETLIAAFAGEVIEVGGIYRIFAGVARSPVATITDADIIVTTPLSTGLGRSRNRLVNAVFGSYADPARLYAQIPLPPRTSSGDEDADGGHQWSMTLDLAAVTSRAQGQRCMEIERRRQRRFGSEAMQLRAARFVLEPGDWVSFTSERRGYVGKTFELASSAGARDLRSDIVLQETDADIDDWDTGLELADDQVIDLPPGGPSLSTIAVSDLDAIVVTGPAGTQRPGLAIEWGPVTDLTIISLKLEYRRLGDTVALSRNILEPDSGLYAWVDGIQGGITYEARLRPVTMPERATTWSAWVSSASESAPQVVSAAAIAYEVPEDTITPEMLSAQARFELSLTTAVDDVLGSPSQQVNDSISLAEKAHIATINALLDASENRAAIRVENRIRQEQDLYLAEQITTVVARLDDQAAQVQQQFTAIATELDATAQSLQTVATAVDGQTAQVTVLAQSINGIESKFGVAVSSNGYVLGLVQLDASAVAGSTFTVVADNFRVAKPGTAGGNAVQVFAIQTVSGVTKLALRGDMIADGSITAQKLFVASLSALSANLGVVTAGLIRDVANKYNFNLGTGKLARTDGRFTIDMDNIILEMVF